MPDDLGERPAGGSGDLKSLWDRALAASAEGDESAAYKLFWQAIELDPDDPVLHYNLGHSAHLLGKNKKAVEHYTAAIGIDAEYGDAFLMRAVAFDLLKRHKLAAEDCTKAIDIEPSNALAYNNRGISHRHLGDTRSALSDYNKSIRLDPTVARFYFNRAILFEQLNDEDRAVADYKMTISIDAEHEGAAKSIERLLTNPA